MTFQIERFNKALHRAQQSPERLTDADLQTLVESGYYDDDEVEEFRVQRDAAHAQRLAESTERLRGEPTRLTRAIDTATGHLIVTKDVVAEAPRSLLVDAITAVVLEVRDTLRAEISELRERVQQLEADRTESTP